MRCTTCYMSWASDVPIGSNELYTAIWRIENTLSVLGLRRIYAGEPGLTSSELWLLPTCLLCHELSYKSAVTHGMRIISSKRERE